MTISEIENEIIEEFSMFDDWMEKYEHIIELGKDLPIINQEHKLEVNLIKGCQSRVWLNAEVKNREISYTADSDAIITKGIIALLVRVLNNQDAKEIVGAKLAFIDEIGLKEHLSPTRSNGLVSMIKQMKVYALLMQAS
ncbi:MAG: cysteine desulfuration protein SufE [Urechidicola sp.]|jgi:cysteine desulfuration protein SufE|tara:strand:- start:188 stop:604 length:417 start_codon:yes stop_codon:yes gene_type:complete